MKTELNQNNPEGKFKSRCETGVAWSCPEARCDRAKNLAQSVQPGISGTGVPIGTARPCHLAASATCAGFRGSAVLRVFDPMGLPHDAFLWLNSPP